MALRGMGRGRNLNGCRNMLDTDEHHVNGLLTSLLLHHRYEKEFDGVQDVFELQRNLNNAFAYDLVPAPSVIIAALRAARRVNDYPTAVRIFEGNNICARGAAALLFARMCAAIQVTGSANELV